MGPTPAFAPCDGVCPRLGVGVHPPTVAPGGRRGGVDPDRAGGPGAGASSSADSESTRLSVSHPAGRGRGPGLPGSGGGGAAEHRAPVVPRRSGIRIRTPFLARSCQTQATLWRGCSCCQIPSRNHTRGRDSSAPFCDTAPERFPQEVYFGQRAPARGVLLRQCPVGGGLPASLVYS